MSSLLQTPAALRQAKEPPVVNELESGRTPGPVWTFRGMLSVVCRSAVTSIVILPTELWYKAGESLRQK
jgi:hypothetical protein